MADKNMAKGEKKKAALASSSLVQHLVQSVAQSQAS